MSFLFSHFCNLFVRSEISISKKYGKNYGIYLEKNMVYI